MEVQITTEKLFKQEIYAWFWLGSSESLPNMCKPCFDHVMWREGIEGGGDRISATSFFVESEPAANAGDLQVPKQPPPNMLKGGKQMMPVKEFVNTIQARSVILWQHDAHVTHV